VGCQLSFCLEGPASLPDPCEHARGRHGIFFRETQVSIVYLVQPSSFAISSWPQQW